MNRNHRGAQRGVPLLLALLSLLDAAPALHAQTLPGAALLHALQGGGYVIVMRHASSPRTPPDAASAEADNTQRERQLDQDGKIAARAMGAALRQLKIPVGQVLCSPTYRALQTARLIQFPAPQIEVELGEGDQGMKSAPDGARARWLRARVAQRPTARTNTFLITHLPNLRDAFADEAGSVSDGEALVFLPDGQGKANLVARVKMTDWAQLP